MSAKLEPPSATAMIVILCLLASMVVTQCGGVEAPLHTAAAAPSSSESARAASKPPALPPSSAPPATSVAPPPTKQAYTVAAMGDSLTDTKSHGGKYLAFVQERCPKTRIDNYGKGGDMVNQMRRRFVKQLLASGNEYTHLVVFGGVNDLYSDLTAGRTPKKIAKDLEYMYTTAKKQGMRVIAITVAPWGGFRQYYNARRGAATKQLNDWIREQLRTGSVDHLVDAYPLLSCGDEEKLCRDYEVSFRDGLHLGPKGHEKLGEALYQAAFRDCL